MKKVIVLLLSGLILGLTSCSQYTCPAYAKEKIQKQHHFNQSEAERNI